MRSLSIDIETYSSVDLAKCGVYAYTQAEDFEILLFSYAFDSEAVRVVDLKLGEKLPVLVMEGLVDSKVLKTAFNANFERTCVGAYLNIKLPPEQWNCTEVRALSLGLPGNLAGVAKCLKVEEQKLEEGKALVKYFSLPLRGGKLKGNRDRNLPQDDWDKWIVFKDYCSRDVEVERNVRERLDDFRLTDSEQKIWCLDQRINDRGVRVDSELIGHALTCVASYEERLKAEMVRQTGVSNPKSVQQMRKWLCDSGVETDSLSKERVGELLEGELDEEVRRVLNIRQELSKTSIKKYEAMDRALGKDGRIRGLLQFYGASRTGRWAGRLVQVQNLPQINMQNIDTARKLLRSGRYETLEILYESLTEVLSQLIRTVFVPSPGCRLIAADYSAIEARVLAWLAGERWRMEVFNSHGKLYEASAAKMFRVPIDSIRKSDSIRQKGKIAELALGYQGGTGALIAMGALKMGLSMEELPAIISAWRISNPNIVKFWGDVEKTAVTAVKHKRTEKLQYGLEFTCDGGFLFIRLPSGRRLSYIRPRLEIDEGFMKPYITYEGVVQGTKQWGRIKTYGGKLVENIVQAIARDCLCEAMLSLENEGYDIVMHIHDEVVLDVPFYLGSIEKVQGIMAKPIPWAAGLKLKADAYSGDYYRKG